MKESKFESQQPHPTRNQMKYDKKFNEIVKVNQEIRLELASDKKKRRQLTAEVLELQKSLFMNEVFGAQCEAGRIEHIVSCLEKVYPPPALINVPRLNVLTVPTIANIFQGIPQNPTGPSTSRYLQALEIMSEDTADAVTGSIRSIVECHLVWLNANMPLCR